MPVITEPPKTAWVFRFQMYDVTNDCMHQSTRWGVREVIESLGGTVIGNGREILEQQVLPPHTDIKGLTPRNYDPDVLTGFQKIVK